MSADKKQQLKRKMKNIYIYTNNTEQSAAAAEKAGMLLSSKGFNVSENYDGNADMILVVGGDGAFLHAIKDTGFPDIPFLGINTGHLGFFQELLPDDTGDLLKFCSGEDYRLQPCRLLEAEVSDPNGIHSDYAINDICIKDMCASVVRLRVSIGDNFVEHFSGDGVVIASSAGSTAYNYSLNGCIVDPRVEALQLTPIAPINSSAYRSFTSSLMFPPSYSIYVAPEGNGNSTLGIYADGRETSRGKVDWVRVSLSERKINVVRRADYDFWGKVESKFL